MVSDYFRIKVYNRRMTMTREENVQYCKQCVEIFDDYRYVQWENMEDYQIIKWVVYFKELLKLTVGSRHTERNINEKHKMDENGNLERVTEE
jgi:hypothetical protein